MFPCLLLLLILPEAFHYVQSLPAFDKKENRLLAPIKRNATIELKIMGQPHDLLVGRCKPEDEVLHTENIILNNDGNSQVVATIKIDIEGEVQINCVKVLDKDPDIGAYPNFVDGGVNSKHISFNVTTEYGKGFNFLVEVLGKDNTL